MKSLRDTLENLEKSKTFKDWAKKNKNFYLSYAFYVVDQNDTNWKIGYYHTENDKITSFDVGEKIKIEPAEDILKKEETKVDKIDMDEVKLDLADAISLANTVQKEEFVTENPVKIIAILQNLDKKNVWNITFLTQNYNTLNFKIKADTGRILDKKLVSIMQFGTTIQGLRGQQEQEEGLESPDAEEELED